jgi:hypothetical protein
MSIVFSTSFLDFVFLVSLVCFIIWWYNAGMLVKPENPITDTVVTISYTDVKIMVKFPEHNDEFRELIKRSLSFRWNESYFCWVRSDFWGSIADRVSEAGRVLLEAGFIVDFPTEETLRNALNKSYIEEPEAYIKRVTSDSEFKDFFIVVWRYGHSLYDNAMRIKGARYCKPYVCVPKQRYREIADFADIHNCVLSDSALELARDARSELEGAIVFSFNKEHIEPTENFYVLDELKD